MSSNNIELDPLDALIVSANHHRLLLENDKVRVVETLIPAGERTTIHTHQWAGVLHVKSWSDFVRRDDKDNILVDTRTNKAARRNPDDVMWGAALPPHSLENVGNQTLRIIAVELKE